VSHRLKRRIVSFGLPYLHFDWTRAEEEDEGEEEEVWEAVVVVLGFFLGLISTSSSRASLSLLPSRIFLFAAANGGQSIGNFLLILDHARLKVQDEFGIASYAPNKQRHQ
jgi:hypothetical protein